jgi:hypothetical protein
VESDINFGLRSKSTISPDSKDESKDYDDYSNGRYFSHL